MCGWTSEERRKTSQILKNPCCHQKSELLYTYVSVILIIMQNKHELGLPHGSAVKNLPAMQI